MTHTLSHTHTLILSLSLSRPYDTQTHTHTHREAIGAAEDSLIAREGEGLLNVYPGVIKVRGLAINACGKKKSQCPGYISTQSSLHKGLWRMCSDHGAAGADVRGENILVEEVAVGVIEACIYIHIYI